MPFSASPKYATMRNSWRPPTAGPIAPPLAADAAPSTTNAIQITARGIHISPYHTESGIAVVSALTLTPWRRTVSSAVNRFRELSSQPCENLAIT
jgi:hypothetical protein